MNEQVFAFLYYLGDKNRLFDLGQGIHVNRAQILQKRGGKVQPFTATLRKLKLQSMLFLALAAAQLGLMLYGGFSGVKIALLVLCLLCGGFLYLAQSGNRKAYERALQLYLEVNGEGGTITISEEGITECSEAGTETHFDWTEYVACVMCDEAIVVISKRPVMLIVSRHQETEQGFRQALEALDWDDTIYEVEIQEKRK